MLHLQQNKALLLSLFGCRRPVSFANSLSLRLKIKRNDWLLADKFRKQPIIRLYFEPENELKFYNLEARPWKNDGPRLDQSCLTLW